MKALKDVKLSETFITTLKTKFDYTSPLAVQEEMVPVLKEAQRQIRKQQKKQLQAKNSNSNNNNNNNGNNSNVNNKNNNSNSNNNSNDQSRSHTRNGSDLNDNAVNGCCNIS